MLCKMNVMLYDLKIGCSHSVDVTHINNPHSFYVRSADVRDFMDIIEKPGTPMSAKEIQLGQRVIFKSNILGKYVRGDIRFVNNKVENTECDIFAIDYGCFDQSILLKFIHSLDPQSEPENLSPALAFHCRLYLCEPICEEFTEKVIDIMKTFVGEHTATITVMNRMNDQLVVELRTVDCPRDVAMMMGLLDITTFTKGSSTVNRFYISSERSATCLTQTLNYKHKILKVGDVLHVRVQSGTSLGGFYVAEMNEYKKLIYGQPSFNQYCQNRIMKDQDIVPERMCAVKLGVPPTYERAIIKQILEPNSTALLQLVDWGTDIESKFSSIRSVTSEIYVAQPVLAIYCTTDEEQVWETGLPTFLFRGYEFFIKIMELGNGFLKPHRVNIYPWKM